MTTQVIKTMYGAQRKLGKNNNVLMLINDEWITSQMTVNEFESGRVSSAYYRDVSINTKTAIKRRCKNQGKLKQSELKAKLRYVPETGKFYWINGCKQTRVAAGDLAGCHVHDSVVIGINSGKYRAYSLAYLYMTGFLVNPRSRKFRNGDRMDCSWDNIKPEVDHAESEEA